MRAAQSKGAADLAAFFNPHHAVWLVQCKTGTARMSRQAKREFVELALQTGTVAVLAEPGKNGRGVKFTDLHTDQEVNL